MCVMSVVLGVVTFGDLLWLSVFPQFSGCGSLDPRGWMELASSDYVLFRKRVKAVCMLPFANLVTQWAQTPSQCLLGASVTCDICGKVEGSYQKAQLHKASKHGIKHIARMYIEGDTCPICLVRFASRECAINHVRYRSSVCYENLLIRPPKLTREEANLCDENDRPATRALKAKGLRRHAVDFECVRLSGPLLPIVIDPERASNHHVLGFGHQHR